MYNNNAEDFDEDNDANYVLPAATDSALGGVKQGSGVTIAADGTISAASQIWAEDTGNISRASGYVGIGTTTPTAQLFINGAWNNLLSIKGNGASEKEMRFFSGINYCAIAVNSSNTEAITFRHDTANVGIGNTTPSQKLDVTGNIKTSGTLILGSGTNK